LSRAQRVTSDRISQYALLAADSGARFWLDIDSLDKTRIGAAVGTSLGGTISQEAAYAEIFRKGAGRLAPFTLVKIMYNGPAAHLGLAYKLRRA
jgi:3-oxoacyl-[acyl-carrier-protein] synthase II